MDAVFVPPIWTDEDLGTAHRTSFKNRPTVESSESCVCFFCLTSMPPSQIAEWTDNGQTAIGPYCYVEAILSSDTESLANDRGFVLAMRRVYFW